MENSLTRQIKKITAKKGQLEDKSRPRKIINQVS